MKVLWYLAVPLMMVTAYCVVVWFRSRTPTSLQSGVDSFRREMQALSPEGSSEQWRESSRDTSDSGAPPAPPQRS